MDPEAGEGATFSSKRREGKREKKGKKIKREKKIISTEYIKQQLNLNTINMVSSLAKKVTCTTLYNGYTWKSTFPAFLSRVNLPISGWIFKFW